MDFWAAARVCGFRNEATGIGVFSVVLKLFGFGRRQLLLRMLSCFCVDHRNLLETRMEITAYNLHGGSFHSESWFRNSSLLGTREEPSLL